jgi:hypothetical protein
LPRIARLGLIGLTTVLLAVTIVAAGAPARGVTVPDAAEILSRVPHTVDASSFPTILVGQDVIDWDHTIQGPGAQAIMLTLAENLEIENQAVLRADPSLLPLVDHGDRLIEMQGRLQADLASGSRTITQYQFNSATLALLIPFGRQTGLSLGFDSRGTMIEATYDAAGTLRSQRSAPFALTFVMSRPTGARWLNVAVLPAGARP